MFRSLLCLICSLPTLADRLSPIEWVDLIELNHFYDKQARYVFSQVIFYERLAENGQFRVRSWALVNEQESLTRIPEYNPATEVVTVTMKLPNDVVVRLKSRLFRETWTQNDPEKDDKLKLPEQYRLRLAAESIKKLPN